MKSSDAEILIIPGYSDSGPDHWQTRWEQKLTSARRVVQADFERPDRAAWAGRIVEEVERAKKPVVLVAHSLGVIAAVDAAARLALPNAAGVRVAGALLVAPADIRRPDVPEAVATAYGPGGISFDPLPFPAMLIASRNDVWCDFEAADEFAAAWGAALVDAGDSGHINAASGHGPWPEGLTRFANLLSRL
ncbi:RBBP9/YdeN family alpha/beta hydrolase [Methylobrevis pamukkalensis]|uniref:Alpha/beta hydrolase family protein n=1 Tax=Methylobrevis pamukkalensis TaxID=1439726 RepID=A0A1E3GYK7_9HYPH|nr:alpha/beta fold hydrolase [Methylobrevis pamukkalensis]ODN68626.1 Alpha/beta hydrolase family protein [Methylobrevis pamukkalensis]